MGINNFFSGICAAGLLLAPTAVAEPFGGPAPAKRVAYQRGSSYLGVGVIEITSERARDLHLKDEYGVEVRCVDGESPAAKAGLREGDVVLEYNGQKIEGGEQFMRLVRETPAGHTVKLSVWRAGAIQSVAVAIGQRPPGSFDFDENGHVLSMPPMPAIPPMPPVPMVGPVPPIRIPDIPRAFMTWRSPMLGIESESLNSQLAEYFGVKEGVLVRSVTRDSPAEKAGFKAGDVIVKINGEKVRS